MKTTEQVTEKNARQVETEESLRRYALKSTQEALVELIKKRPTLGYFNIDLMDLYNTLATQLIFDKTTTGYTSPLDILWIFIQATHSIEAKGGSVEERLRLAIEDIEQMYGQLGCKNLNKAILKSQRVSSKILFEIRNKQMLLFADEFFQAIYV